MLEAVEKASLPIDARELPPDRVDDEFRELVRQGVRRIGVSGGDGTIASVAAIAAQHEVELAIIPGGTLNHLAGDLDIPDDLEKALRIAVEGEARSVDAAQVNDQFFLNTSSFGMYVTFVRLRERLEKYLGYRLASFVAAVRLFVTLRTFIVDLEVDGTKQSHVSPVVFVGVGERELKMPKLGSRLPDSQRGMHLMIVRGRSRARLAALAFAAVARGTESVARSPELTAFMVKEFTVRMRRRRGRVATDGEIRMMNAPLTYRWLPDAVRIVTPPEDAER